MIDRHPLAFMGVFLALLFVAFCGLGSLLDGPCMEGFFPHAKPDGWNGDVKCYSGEVIDFREGAQR